MQKRLRQKPPLQQHPQPPTKEAEPTAPAPSSNDDKPAPEVLDLLDELDELDDGLDQWGPKPSDGQKEFHPIPQELQDSKQDEVDAKANSSIFETVESVIPEFSGCCQWAGSSGASYPCP